MPSRLTDRALGLYRRAAALPRPAAIVASSLALYLVYMLLGQANYAFVLPPYPNGVFWLPSGMNFALFIRARSALWLWPWWLAALFAAELSLTHYHGIPWPVGIAWGVANGLVPLAAVLLTRRLVPKPFALRQIRDVIMFGVITVVAAVPGAIVAALAAAIGLKGQSFTTMAFSWWSSDALGVLLGAPVLLTWTTRQRRPVGTPGEALALLLCLTAVLMLFRHEYPMMLDWSLPTLLLALIAWAAIRFGPRATSLATLLLDLIIVGTTMRGVGPFATSGMTPYGRLLNLQILAANFCLLTLLLAAAIEEQRAARAAAEAAARARDEFLSIASHELRTPLTALQVAVQLLLGRKNQPHEISNRCLDIILRQVQKLMLLSGELLDTTRIREGRLALTLEEVDLQVLTTEVTERVLCLIGQTGSTFTVRADVSICGRWDRTKLEQILLNLLSNAGKFGDGKPIELAVDLEADGLARITVTDHGVGIPPERLDGIFECFGHDIDRHYGGLGMGLFIVRSLVQRLGGSVTVMSAVGAGSSFTVRLPITGPLS